MHQVPYIGLPPKQAIKNKLLLDIIDHRKRMDKALQVKSDYYDIGMEETLIKTLRDPTEKAVFPGNKTKLLRFQAREDEFSFMETNRQDRYDHLPTCQDKAR